MLLKIINQSLLSRNIHYLLQSKRIYVQHYHLTVECQNKESVFSCSMRISGKKFEINIHVYLIFVDSLFARLRWGFIFTHQSETAIIKHTQVRINSLCKFNSNYFQIQVNETQWHMCINHKTDDTDNTLHTTLKQRIFKGEEVSAAVQPSVPRLW